MDYSRKQEVDLINDYLGTEFTEREYTRARVALFQELQGAKKVPKKQETKQKQK